MTNLFSLDEAGAEREAKALFEQAIGTSITCERSIAGNQPFLKFVVGREAPLYHFALRETQKTLSAENPLRGALSLKVKANGRFPESVEAGALQTLLTKSTRAVSENTTYRGFSVPYIPFQNREDHKLAQPASHVLVGRRGVGKSTLIKRASELIRASPSLVGIVDVQTHSSLSGDELAREVIYDCIKALTADLSRASKALGKPLDPLELEQIASDLIEERITPTSAPPRLKRALAKITSASESHVYIFLDDFHLLNFDDQPWIIHLIHGALKGVNGWIKVAGLRSLLNYYSPRSGYGLQVPGDAQLISLDLTLENPEQAEAHLKAILENFLGAVGYPNVNSVLPSQAFTRIAWANAGVPRDFLQMFDRAIEHARRNRHTVVTLSDVNAAIGESGQFKMTDLEEDARNTEGELVEALEVLDDLCLQEAHTNGFLVRSENSEIRRRIHVLSDLRLVHLINQSITPDRAGERYEAYILDYSLFTGFRRRRGIVEMVPDEGQFKASQLRRLPKATDTLLASTRVP